jgi:iron complex outermembrane recepter protein
MKKIETGSNNCFVQFKMILATGIALGALASTPVFAQSAKPAAEEAGSSDIIVTARRTDERLQDVPVAVTAFGATALAERRISSETDLQTATPGLTVRQTISSNQLNYAIRGQSIDAFSFTAPAVTAYFNDVQVGGTSATSFFDLQSIQVLKGPQGTLFGRNATGGAVLYSAAKPTGDFGGYLKGAYGNFNDVEVEGAINLPITSGIALRLSGRSQTRDGFQHDLIQGIDLNSIDSQVGRASLLIKPEGSGFENVTVVQKGKYGGNNGGLKMTFANGVNGAPATYLDPITNTTKPLTTNFRDSYPAGVVSTDPRVNARFSGISDYLTKAGTSGFYDVFLNRDNSHSATQTFISNTTSFEASDSLTIKNIFGYNKVLSYDDTDVDGAPYSWLDIGGDPTGFSSGYVYGTKQFSDELQLSGKAGALTYIVGAFYSKEKTYNRIPLCITCDIASTPGPVPNVGFQGAYDFTQTDESKALYAQATYDLTDKLSVTGGLRYTWETVSMNYGQDPTSIGGIVGELPVKRKDSKPSWLISLQYKASDDLMFYLNQRGSWRTGGFNGTSLTAAPGGIGLVPTTFKPETTYDFEAGMKFSGDIGASRATLNVAIYDQYIKNVQRSPYIGISAVAGNVNNARVTGAEVDGTVTLSKNLQIGASGAYTKARYTDGIADVNGTKFLFGPYGDAPKFTGSAFFRASTELGGDGGELALRGEVYTQSKFFYSNLANTIIPNALIKGYTLVNGRVEWNEIMGSKVHAAFFVNNLTDKEYNAGGIALSAVTGSNAVLPGAPRMYGLEVGIKF